ncbi:hypothetical protein GF312_12120 [Candidatus Poribacteria bacterium]|nr:hypothetical protein [Candidatus Poribacteria bacterium]
MNIHITPNIKEFDNLNGHHKGNLNDLANDISVFIEKVTKDQNEICQTYSKEEMDAFYEEYQKPEKMLDFLKRGYLVYAENKNRIIALRMIIKDRNKYIPRLFFISPEYRNSVYISILLCKRIAAKLRELGVNSYEFPALKFPETLKLYRSLPGIEEIGLSEDGLTMLFKKEINWSKQKKYLFKPFMSLQKSY